jgi:hypothetical protein
VQVFLWGNLGGRKALGRPTHRLENDIKIDIQEI